MNRTRLAYPKLSSQLEHYGVRRGANGSAWIEEGVVFVGAPRVIYVAYQTCSPPPGARDANAAVQLVRSHYTWCDATSHLHLVVTPARLCDRPTAEAMFPINLLLNSYLLVLWGYSRSYWTGLQQIPKPPFPVCRRIKLLFTRLISTDKRACGYSCFPYVLPSLSLFHWSLPRL